MTAIRSPLNRSRVLFGVAVVTVAVVLQLLGAQPAVSQSSVLTSYRTSTGPGLDPSSNLWGGAPAVDVPLTAQQVVWPFGGGSTRVVKAQALHTDDTLYIRMSWSDRTRDDEAIAVDRFVDAAAVEFPADAASSVPSLCMGQADGGVNIWHWQAGVENGRPSTVEALSGEGYVDRYPSTDEAYFPARAAGNPVADPTGTNELVAVGFGTLSNAERQHVSGHAEWAHSRWSVVFARELSSDSAQQVDLGQDVTTDVAFAVWDGNADERNGIKSVSEFVVLDITAGGRPTSSGLPLAILLGSSGLLGAFLLMERAARRTTGDDSEGSRS